MASKYKERLAAMKDSYEASQGAYDQMFGGVDIPEGVYEARLQSAKIVESKSSGKLMIRREHLITEGEYKGMVAWDNMMLETPNGWVYVRRWIEMMGYQAPTADEIENVDETIDAIVNESPDVKVRLTRDGDFTNISIVELLATNEGTDDGEAQPEAEPEAEEPTDDGAASLQELVAAGKAEGAELSDETNREQVIADLSEYTWELANLEADSVDIFRAAGIPIEGDEGGEEQPEEDPDAELKERLVTFCTAQDVKYEEDDDVEMLKERMDGFDYPEDSLTDEEKALLVEIGQEANIKKAAPKKAAPPKKGGKAPAKKGSGRKAPPKKK